MVNRIARPRMACSGCETFTQLPLPSRPIERGRPGPGLMAHMLVSRYADHLPLCRQSQIVKREGFDLDRSHLTESACPPRCWNRSPMHLGGMSWPGRRSSRMTRRSRCGARHRQDRDGAALGLWARRAALGWPCPARHLVSLLARSKGPAPQGTPARISRLDACRWLPTGPETSTKSPACPMSGASSSTSTGPGLGRPSPTEPSGASRSSMRSRRRHEGRRRTGASISARRRWHQSSTKLKTWLRDQLPTISGKSPLAVAIRYALTRMKRLRPYLDHGILALDNNTAERAMRSVAPAEELPVRRLADRRSRHCHRLHPYRDRHAKRCGPAGMAAARIADHKITRVDDLMPWNWSNDAAWPDAYEFSGEQVSPKDWEMRFQSTTAPGFVPTLTSRPPASARGSSLTLP